MLHKLFVVLLSACFVFSVMCKEDESTQEVQVTKTDEIKNYDYKLIASIVIVYAAAIVFGWFKGRSIGREQRIEDCLDALNENQKTLNEQEALKYILDKDEENLIDLRKNVNDALKESNSLPSNNEHTKELNKLYMRQTYQLFGFSHKPNNEDLLNKTWFQQSAKLIDARAWLAENDAEWLQQQDKKVISPDIRAINRIQQGMRDNQALIASINEVNSNDDNFNASFNASAQSLQASLNAHEAREGNQ